MDGYFISSLLSKAICFPTSSCARNFSGAVFSKEKSSSIGPSIPLVISSSFSIFSRMTKTPSPRTDLVPLRNLNQVVKQGHRRNKPTSNVDPFQASLRASMSV